MEPYQPGYYTDTQLLNFTALSTVQMSMQRDALGARLKFQLTAGECNAFATLDAARIQVLAAQLPVSLFVPRAGLVQLLNAPVALAPVLAASSAGTASLPRRSPGRRRTDRT